ncbi:methylamine utilization protein [Scleromatobacter humisilvae]|uniref:Methylamine utilization protein n=1 Tax=Scleromatobacter humisilvae TaxID=2897159 RepID=A0A9X1YKS7_9BURK|nr:methylamine utilization protein [Scleromatobacter humisilvae]MCK9688389.1 methylamine utilization protein [Scleromatobacter humisilvae]
MFARLALIVALSSAAVAQAAGVSIVVTDPAGHALADAVVMLEPVGAPLPVKPMAGAQIAQKDLEFHPAVTVVTVGTPVLFPNQDTVKHHVYSYSAAKTFQIKLYAGVPHTPIVFDKPGVAVLGCNIHDGMIAWVVVTDTPLWARSAASGAARVLDVPPGNYQMHVWHSSLAETTPPQLLPLTVAAGDVEQRIRLGTGGLIK